MFSEDEIMLSHSHIYEKILHTRFVLKCNYFLLWKCRMFLSSKPWASGQTIVRGFQILCCFSCWQINQQKKRPPTYEGGRGPHNLIHNKDEPWLHSPPSPVLNWLGAMPRASWGNTASLIRSYQQQWCRSPPHSQEGSNPTGSTNTVHHNQTDGKVQFECKMRTDKFTGDLRNIISNSNLFSSYPNCDVILLE